MALAVDAVDKILKMPFIKESEKTSCRAVQHHLWLSAIVSYAKPFINTRKCKLGILSKKDIGEYLKIDECRQLHDEIISLRNKHIAHNDLSHSLSIISYSENDEMHFPQVLKLAFFDYEKLRRMWALIKCIESHLLGQIFTIIKDLNLQKNRIKASDLTSLSTLKHLEVLNLHSTQVNKEVFELIKNIPSLKKVFLWNTKVRLGDISKNRAEFPTTELVFDL